MKKFRDMTDGEKLEIIKAMIAGKPLEVSPDGESWCNYLYVSKGNKIIVLDDYYRIPKRPMSIDWSVLKDEYICAAIDENGYAGAFTSAPFKSSQFWQVKSGGHCYNITGLKSYDPGTVDWTESLIWRPGFEPK